MSAFDDLKELAAEDIEKASPARYRSGTNSHYGYAKPPRKHADSFVHGRVRHRSRLHHTNIRRTPGKVASMNAEKSSKTHGQMDRVDLTVRNNGVNKFLSPKISELKAQKKKVLTKVPSRVMPLPKSVEGYKSIEESDMKKSKLEQLQDIAKAGMGIVTRAGGQQVNMGSAPAVRQAQAATRVRAQQIRTASPMAAMPKPMPKSINGKKTKKSTSPAFDMDKFDRENPVIQPQAHEQLKETHGLRKINKYKKKPNADEQAMKMKSAAKLIDLAKGYTILPPGKAKGSDPVKPSRKLTVSDIAGFKRTAKKPTADTQAMRMKSIKKSAESTTTPTNCAECEKPLNPKTSNDASHNFGKENFGAPVCKECHDYYNEGNNHHSQEQDPKYDNNYNHGRL